MDPLLGTSTMEFRLGLLRGGGGGGGGSACMVWISI